MNDQQQAFERVLSLIDEAGCQDYLVLIGSWAEFVWRESGLLDGFNPNIRTLDVDFLVKNLRRPDPPVSLAAIAQQRGFIVESDRLDGTTKILDLSGLEVEFLIGKRGAGIEPALKTNVGVTAQTLRHLEILLHNTIVLTCLGHSVTVPEPEAYALHKMIINRQRKGKATKDAQAVVDLWPYLDYAKLNDLGDSLSKNERAAVEAFKDAHYLEP